MTTALLPSAWVLLLFHLLSARNEEVIGPRALPLEYAASRSETLSTELVIGVIEVMLLTVVLQPWRQTPLWPRAMAAFALFLPWAALRDDQRSAHDRDLRLFRLLRERDDRVAAAFNDLRRSTGIQLLASMINLEVVSSVELGQFTPATRESAMALAEIFSPRGKRPGAG